MSRLAFAVMLVLTPPLWAQEYPEPEPTRAEEPLARAYSRTQAAAYLDAVGVNWTRDRQCATCHTNIPYLMARPLLHGSDAGWKEVRTFLEADVQRWAKTKPRGDAYVVVTAVALAFNDAQTMGKLSNSAHAALETMWKRQKPTGEWNWLKCDWPPLEHDDYYGAVLAAVGVGYAPGNYAQSKEAAEGVQRLGDYLHKTPAPDLHHQAMKLWASVRWPELMTADERARAIQDLLALQQSDGGWSLASLGTYQRRDKTMNDPGTPSDGYGTGFVVFALQQAGVKPDSPAIKKGKRWLETQQRTSGRWYTRSLTNDKAHYIANAGTAFAVLALEAQPANASRPAK